MSARGPGWERLAGDVGKVIATRLVDAVWVFPVRRHDQREYGTAVVTVLDPQDHDRRCIYTARYMLQVKGKERGRYEGNVEEVGSSPLDTLERVLHEVHLRADDEFPPVQIAPSDWLSATTDDAALSG